MHMKYTHFTILLLGMLGLLNSPGLHASAPQELPVEVLFANPLLSQPRVSPDGRYIAMLQPANNRMNIMVLDLLKGGKKQITNMKEENIVSFGWIKNGRILFNQQNKGQESFGYYAIDADGRNLVVLQQATSRSGDDLENADDRQPFAIIDDLPDDPNNILVNGIRGRSGLGDIFRVNVNTGKRFKVMNNLGKTRDWVTDRNGVVRIAISSDEREETAEIMYRETARSEWVSLGVQTKDTPSWAPLGFDGDNKTLYVKSNIDRATTAIYKFDFEKKAPGELVFADDTYDAGNIVYNEYLKKVVGVFYESEYAMIHWLDDTAKNTMAAIDAVLPGTKNQIGTMTRDGSACIVVATSDRNRPCYYYLDLKNNKMLLLGYQNDKINPDEMAPMKPVTFTARDGMVIHAYLTLPVGRPHRKLPLIVHPHGGPFGIRDSWGYNPEVQFYANRGYAVIQVNYRGSGGYGRAFEEAGYRQWGLKMQNDLTDAVKWTVDQGYVDANRVGISGASYGGYAALAGLVYTPELYKLGINYVGVSDIARLGLHIGFDHMTKPEQKSVARRFLHPVLDSRQMKEVSPVNYIERIQVPSLHAYGKYDPRVTIDQGEVLKQKLDKYDKTYEYIEVENEGHGFTKYENSVKFYKIVDEFLKKYMPAEPGKRASVQLGDETVIEMPATRR